MGGLKLRLTSESGCIVSAIAGGTTVVAEVRVGYGQGRGWGGFSVHGSGYGRDQGSRR